MGDACHACKGKGYIWTGAERVLCHVCGGSGSGIPLPREKRPLPGQRVPG